MTLCSLTLFYIHLAVIFYFTSRNTITAQYSVSVERPCPMETVTFTCTAPGDSLRWLPSDVTVITVRSTSGLNVVNVVSGYTVTLIAANDTTLTSTLSRTAENDITVSCEYAMPDQTTVGSSTIILAGPPKSPSIVRQSVLSSSVSEVNVTVGWDPPTETGGREDLTYTVTISPPAQLSATILTSTSVTMTVQYNVNYTVSVVATNCAGSSTTAEYNFSIGGCPVLTNPMNGAFGPVSSRLPGSTVTIQCDAGYVSTVTMVTCEGTLMWSPNPEAIGCSESPTTPPPTTTSPPMNCTVPLSSPRNGTISDPSVPAIPGTQVTFQCDNGLFPEGTMTATCLATGKWDKNPMETVCRIEPISCVLPASPVNGALLNTNSLNTNPIKEGSVITFQCDPGFSPVGAVTVTCNNSGLWDPDLALLECSVATPTTGGNVASVAGGVAGGIVIAFIIILVVIVILVVLRGKRKESVRLKSNDSIEMDNKFDGEYSELRHDGPKKNSKKYQPPAADEEGYNRITHNVNPASQNPASLTYDEVTINSDKKIAVNEEGYSVMDTGQGAQRLPGYGQLGNVATVEPVVYAALSSSQPHKKGKNTTATVDQHQVTYATVDVAATSRKQTKAATLPTSPTASAPALPDVDKLLDIDQALVQIRSMDHKWRELAETMRLPETMIEQIEDSCGINHSGCLTEVIDQWMRNCSGRPTWRELAGHLHNIGEEQLSQELLNIYNTGRLPVELNMKAVPSTVYKYDRAPPPPLPSRSPTMTDDGPGLPKALPPSRPPKPTIEIVPARPPKPAPNNEPPAPPLPSKHYTKH